MSREQAPIDDTNAVQQEQSRSASLLNRIRRNAVPAGAVVLALSIGGYELFKGGNNESANANQGNIPVLVGSETQADANCSTLELGNAANNQAEYNQHAFLPAEQVTDPEDAKQYVLNLFSANGPLAGKNADPASLAAIMATIVTPAHEKGFINTNYNYGAEWNNSYSSYTQNDSQTNLANARRDCAEAVTTLTQDVGYNPLWAKSGDTVTRFTALRDNSNNITNAELDTGPIDTTLEGIEIAPRATSKNENGYNSVLISTNSQDIPNGTIYFKGYKPEQVSGSTNTSTGTKPITTKPQYKQLPKGAANGFNGNVISQSTVTSSTGGTISPGKTNEALPGPLSGKSTGPNKGPHSEAKTAPGKTPNGGSGSGSGEKPGPGPGSVTVTTETPPPPATTTTTETPPPPPVTTPTPPPVTTPTTPTPPLVVKGPDPGQPGA